MDQPVRTGQIVDRDDDPLRAGPSAADALRPDMVEHLRVHRLRGAGQRQFAQCRQVGVGEEVLERAGRFLRQIDLADLQSLDQLVGRNVDDLDLGCLQHVVR